MRPRERYGPGPCGGASSLVCPRSAASAPALGAVGLILAAGAGVRLWLLMSQRPALIGYADSYAYVTSAIAPLFSDPLRPAG